MNVLNEDELDPWGRGLFVEQRQQSDLHLLAGILTELVRFVSVGVEETGHFSADIRSTDLYLWRLSSEISSVEREDTVVMTPGEIEIPRRGTIVS